MGMAVGKYDLIYCECAGGRIGAEKDMRTKGLIYKNSSMALL